MQQEGPFEVCYDHDIASKFSEPELRPHYSSKILDRNTEDFFEEEEDDGDAVKTVWELCQEYAAKSGNKRKLVSLFEANEVAKRLAKQSEHERINRRRDDEDYDGDREDHAQDSQDEVQTWMDCAFRLVEDAKSKYPELL